MSTIDKVASEAATKILECLNVFDFYYKPKEQPKVGTNKDTFCCIKFRNQKTHVLVEYYILKKGKLIKYQWIEMNSEFLLHMLNNKEYIKVEEYELAKILLLDLDKQHKDGHFKNIGV
jgi:hypothetical protein